MPNPSVTVIYKTHLSPFNNSIIVCLNTSETSCVLLSLSSCRPSACWCTGKSQTLVKHYLAPPWHTFTCLAMLSIWQTFINKFVCLRLYCRVLFCVNHMSRTLLIFSCILGLYCHFSWGFKVIITEYTFYCITNSPNYVLLLTHFRLK